MESAQAKFPEYELAGIEVIARGVCVQDGKVLLCLPKSGGRTYLPGGHIEFGEKGDVALKREMREEMQVEATVGKLLGVVESMFEQNAKPHHEINLVYEMTLPDGTAAKAAEDWIAFTWQPVERIHEANLLPAEMIRYVVANS